jgi:anti-sigma-K factor RskA
VSDIDVHHLAAAYALDAVDDHERAAFEAHYPTCAICRVDVVELRETLALLAAGDASTPPPSVKDRVMAEIARTRQLSPIAAERDVVRTDLLDARRRRRTTTMLLAAAAVVGVLAAGAVVLDRDTTPSHAAALAEVLEQPDGRVVDLTPADGGGDAADVRVAWSETAGRAVLLADGLREAPDGRAYELWLIDADGPAPMHVLDGADDGDIRDVMDLDADPVAWGITIEPEAGSPTPTGEVLFVAEV